MHFKRGAVPASCDSTCRLRAVAHVWSFGICSARVLATSLGSRAYSMASWLQAGSASDQQAPQPLPFRGLLEWRLPRKLRKRGYTFGGHCTVPCSGCVVSLVGGLWLRRRCGLTRHTSVSYAMSGAPILRRDSGLGASRCHGSCLSVFTPGAFASLAGARSRAFEDVALRALTRSHLVPILVTTGRRQNMSAQCVEEGRLRQLLILQHQRPLQGSRVRGKSQL